MKWKAVEKIVSDAIKNRKVITVSVKNGSVTGRPTEVRFIKRLGYFSLGMQTPAASSRLPRPLWIKAPDISFIDV